MHHNSTPASRPRLIYVIGPSGAGKDSLIDYCRQRLACHSSVVFAHRYITRAANAGSENHIALANAEFAARKAAGLFALCWHGHGLDYGIGIEINQWLGKGINVVVNGSRDYLDQAHSRYPELLPVWITVSPDVQRARLNARARENEPDIESRLARAALLRPPAHTGIVISNDGALAEAGEALLAVITRGLNHGNNHGGTACA